MADTELICGVDHVGYAVRDLEEGKTRFTNLGFVFHENQEDLLRNVDIALGVNEDGFRVELLAPAKDKKSPIDGILSKIGAAPYHICYEVRDMDKAISFFQEDGYMLISAPAASVPLSGTVCFLYCPEIGIIELIEYGGKNDQYC